MSHSASLSLRDALAQLDTDAANFDAASKAEEDRRDWAMADRWRYMATATREAVRVVRAALQRDSAAPSEPPALDVPEEVRDYIHRQVGLAVLASGPHHDWRENADPYLVKAAARLAAPEGEPT